MNRAPSVSPVGVPPIKSQGIKSKLIPWIRATLPGDFVGRWIEPFMGTCAVGLNVAPRAALFCDTNPHLVEFYRSIADGRITAETVKTCLTDEGAKLLARGEAYYYEVRDRFNAHHAPLDFLFLNRAGFNGMIRFNRSGGFNIPFCRKPRRFAPAYVTKIANQVAWVGRLLKSRHFEFICQPFETTIAQAEPTDMIYCDPPYIDRHVDYYNGWNAAMERSLFECLSRFRGRFILSTWHHNAYRANEFVASLWSRYNVLTREHFYHVGARERNRNAMVEALVTNFDVPTAAAVSGDTSRKVDKLAAAVEAE